MSILTTVRLQNEHTPDDVGAVVQYQATKVLLDGRTVKGKPEDVECLYYGEFAAKEIMRLVREHGLFPRFAFVIHQPLCDPRRFGETVAVNRGMNIKTFETSEEAFEWLEHTPNKSDAVNG
jgi:hypothetical protein